MNSLSDKLKALGVKQGFSEIHPPQPKDSNDIQKYIPGYFSSTPNGDTFISENIFYTDYIHGNLELSQDYSLGFIAEWLDNPAIKDIQKEKICFIDTETTGLSRGTGTYAFLIGIGYFIKDHFKVTQIFLQNPSQEAAQLLKLENLLARFEMIVSYNGKAFDIPILRNRYILHGWREPFSNLFHIDLLYIARRLWKERLPSRTLSSIEANIIGFLRSEEDVPGWLVPQIYFDYLIDHNAEPLKRVFYHNSMDVLSLSALLNICANLTNNNLFQECVNPFDTLALAKIYKEKGHYDNAIYLFTRFIELPEEIKQNIPRKLFIDALYHLASIYKLIGNKEMAINYWIQASEYDEIPAHIELAKFFEHVIHDYYQANYWSEAARKLVIEKSSIFEAQQWLLDLDYRINRIQRKISSNVDNLG